MVEEFVEGQEYSVEYISYEGVHTFLAVTFKFTTGAPRFIESGHFQPAPISKELESRIRAVVEHALDSLEIKYGASCTEVKVDDKGNIKLIEVCPRMGGDCIGSDLVKYSTGYDYVGMVAQIACGEKPDFTKIVDPIPAESVFIFTQEDLDDRLLCNKIQPNHFVIYYLRKKTRQAHIRMRLPRFINHACLSLIADRISYRRESVTE